MLQTCTAEYFGSLYYSAPACTVFLIMYAVIILNVATSCCCMYYQIHQISHLLTSFFSDFERTVRKIVTLVSMEFKYFIREIREIRFDQNVTKIQINLELIKI